MPRSNCWIRTLEDGCGSFLVKLKKWSGKKMMPNQISVVSPCHVFHLSIYFGCTPSDAFGGPTLQVFPYIPDAWFPSPTQPSMARNAPGSYTFRSGCWTHKQHGSDSTKQNMKLSDIPPKDFLGWLAWYIIYIYIITYDNICIQYMYYVN